MIKHYPTYNQALILLVIWLLATVASVLVLMPRFSIEDGLGLTLMYVFSMLITVASGFATKGEWRVPTGTFPISILFFASLAILCNEIIFEPLQNLVPVSEPVIKMAKSMQQQPYVYFFMIVIAAPLLEETLFRGIILEGFLKNYKPTPAILVSALLFGLVHGNFTQGFNAFILGVLFGWLYWKTNSIIPGIVLHAVNNLIAFVITLNTKEIDFNKSIRDLMNNDFNYTILYLLSVVVAAGCLWFIHQKYFPQIQTEITVQGENENSEIGTREESAEKDN